jgi:outer membrane immunogenic protein
MKMRMFAIAAALGFTANTALAADLPSRAAPPVFVPPPPVWTWTGCYVGVEGGGTTGHSQHFAAETPAGVAQTGGLSLSGGLAGGTAGCNYQTANFVLGGEGDFSWTSKRGSASLVPPFNTADVAETKETWLSTFRGRVGVTMDRWLIFATGGGALASQTALLCDPTAGCGSLSKTLLGWTGGAGVEYAIGNNWSIKGEYLHVDLGTQGYPRIFSTTTAGFFQARTVRTTDEIFRLGVNYRFNWFVPPAPAPVVAKY